MMRDTDTMSLNPGWRTYQPVRAAAWPVIVAVLLMPFPSPACAYLSVSSKTRGMSLRASSSIRTLSAALQSYRVDHNAFPPPPVQGQLPVHCLTTPVAYLGDWVPPIMDPFKVTRIQRNRFGTLVPALWVMVPCGIGFLVLSLVVLGLVDGVMWFFGGKRLARISLPQVIAVAVAGGFIGRALVWPFPLDDEHEVRISLPPGTYTLFNYWTDGNDVALLASVGPDGKQDLIDLSREEVSCIAHADTTDSTASAAVAARYKNALYDPTNGTKSSGDICTLVVPK